ncbi:MAG: pantetheine-phosphate adenylyltransferase [Bacteroidia bacterium]|jgi:pantetheine-phosphate adenylyltransferase|nr:pantetheine-phosphate adenylyltransferase [Bacteroidia bacterium]|tara:strand:- start:583 stop:1053 length:471 start_codon:yes stop_codon:yes gene_type:complete
MSKVALFPGTFDPFTLGHLDIVNRGLNMFDEVVVAIGMNTGKKHMFSLEQREQWIKEIFDNEPRVRVASYEGLTAKYAEQIGAHFILRGLRTNQDFTYEKQIAYVNEDMSPSINSVFLMSHQTNATVSSTIVRDLIQFGGDYEKYLPTSVCKAIRS